VGLLLLRAALGAGLLAAGVQALRDGAGASWGGALACVLVVDGLALLVGALTPIAAVPAVVVLLGRALAPGVQGTAADPAAAWALVVAVAVGLLGPGAYSVDARLFGRREIEVPRHARPDPPHPSA
jgi:uncharacterized membrane protein YphA (DoxX/SURF4 family)